MSDSGRVTGCLMKRFATRKWLKVLVCLSILVIALRGEIIVSPTVHAQEVLVTAEHKASFTKSYRNYLNRDFKAAGLESLKVTAAVDVIDVEFQWSKASGIRAQDIRVAMLPTFQSSQRVPMEQQILEVKPKRMAGSWRFRFERYGDDGLDRSHARFVLVRSQQAGIRVLSPATYVTCWRAQTQRRLQKLEAKHRKGLGGVPAAAEDPQHEIYDLGIGHATVNIVLNGLIDDRPRQGFVRTLFEGKPVFVNEALLAVYQRRLTTLRQKGVVVSAILLVSNRRQEGQPLHPLIHPEARQDEAAKYAMPNLAQPKGAHVYRAIMSLLTDRFAQEGPGKPRVSNWIMHNEIDQAGTWTSMGPQPIERYFECFMRSARLVHQLARRHNRHARVFVSLTHFWNRISSGRDVYRVRDLLDLMAASSKREGDFEWGVAYHPYPQSLREPRTWEDANVAFHFETPLVTPRNIEVLPAYLDQKPLWFEGKPRAILLSEQGCNARSLSAEDQRVQAAGIVYMYLRMRHLPTVEAFHYHAFRDQPGAEGGLLLGLITNDGRPKYAWNVYRALDSRDEAKAIEFAWAVMGEAARRETGRIVPVAKSESETVPEGASQKGN